MTDDSGSAVRRAEAAESEPIQTRSVPEIVAARLRDDILSGQLKPGDRLIEQKWAARFGIGQPTLREAFRELQLEGFLTRSRQRGTYVAELSREECLKLLEVRMALESVAIQRAAVRMNPEALKKIADELQRMEAAAHELDPAQFHAADLAFHERVWELAENEHISRILEQVTTKFFAFLRKPSAAGAEYAEAVEQHKQIFEGLRSGDPVAALESFKRSTAKMTALISFWPHLMV